MRKAHFFSRDWDRRERRLDWFAKALDAWHKKWFSDKLPENPKLPLAHPMPGFSFDDRRRVVTGFLYSWSIGAVKVKFTNSQIEKDFRERAKFLTDNPLAPEAQVKEVVRWMLGFLIDGRFDGTIQGATRKAPKP